MHLFSSAFAYLSIQEVKYMNYSNIVINIKDRLMVNMLTWVYMKQKIYVTSVWRYNFVGAL